MDANIHTDVDVDVVFVPVSEGNIEKLRELNQTTLEVKYPDKFYQNALRLPKQLVCLCRKKEASVFIGSICCRIENPCTLRGSRFSWGGNGNVNFTPNVDMLYIMTLNVLPSYRGRSLGSRLVKHVLEAVQERKNGFNCKGAYLHVWTENKDALRFYQRLGFKVQCTINNYYRRISPPDCHIVALFFSEEDENPQLHGGRNSSSQSNALMNREEGKEIL